MNLQVKTEQGTFVMYHWRKKKSINIVSTRDKCSKAVFETNRHFYWANLMRILLFYISPKTSSRVSNCYENENY